MKKILVFTSLFGRPFFGGAETTVFEFYKSLAQLDSQIVICTLDKKFANVAESDELRNIQLKRFSTRLPHPVIERNESKFTLRLLSHFLNFSIGMRPFALLREFWSLKPNLVITHNLAGWGYLPWIIANFLRIPIIHDNHDMYLICVKTTRWKPEQGNCVRTCKQCLPRLVATKLSWKGGVMVSNSEYLKYEIEKRITDKVRTDYEIVYPPIKFAPEFDRPSQIKYDAVFVGRIEESKGIRQFLQASNGKGLVIGVGGVGELREELEAKYPQVSFLGQVNGQNLLAQSRILVVPSLWHETFGRVVVEGIAVGIPVLVSNRGGIVEFKNRNGSQIIVINPEDVADFANKIDFALTMERNDEPINTEWLEDHYENQLVKFKSVVSRILYASP